jgi:hypothetical protein
MERWTFLVIAGPDGEPAQLRVLLRHGEDPTIWPAAQLGMGGAEVPVDQQNHDFEAPEWKAAQLLDAGTGQAGAARLEQIKRQLRSQVAA